MEKEYTGHYKDIYLREPQGNVMAVYRIRKDSLFLTELPMYGEKRLGVIKENRFLMKKPTQNGIATPVIVTASKPPAKTSIYPLGKKHYETTDWLGNVRVTYTDKKSWQQNKFALNVSSSQDYYPFGAVMEGRNLEITNYRFGYGGHEKIDEVTGSGNTIDMGDRWLDTRIGRTYKQDRKDNEYPGISAYTYAANNPMRILDPDGQFLLDVHQRITQKALEGFEIHFFKDGPFSSIANVLATQEFEEGLIGMGTFMSGGITWPDIKDFLGNYDPKEHFDNMNYNDIVTNLNTIYNQMHHTVQNFKQGEINIQELGHRIGQNLHAIQDFYSHSNYIELYAQQYGQVEDLSSIPTLEEVLSDTKYAEFRSILKEQLKTGIYPGQGEGSHRELNKDVGAGSKYTEFLGETEGKKVTYVSLAAEVVATKASKQFLGKVKEEIEK
ncbi:MAG: hypothetical protein KatS3mg035_2242 [Bacteroidia bacterium]|nr:MAG: hypothetical protein KatS3mg035_2242 [Bacteroidia bacterium]